MTKRDGPRKIQELSEPYRPPNKLFHFLVSPFLVFGPISHIFRSTSKDVGLRFEKKMSFFPEK